MHLGTSSQLSVVSLEQVQQIFDAFYKEQGKDRSHICNFTERRLLGFSCIVQHTSYVVHLSDGALYILMIPGSVDASTTVPFNIPTICTPLTVYQSLLKLLSDKTSIPHPVPLQYSDTLAIIPYEYLILTCPLGTPLSELRRSGKLSERQNMLIDLQIGRWMREMHDKVQNDWFGLPKTTSTQVSLPTFGIPGIHNPACGQGGDEEEPSYSWQETFTSLLESLMQSAETLEVTPAISYADLRRHLGRAIGSFLFDDCEVPSLVSFLGDDGSVFVDIPEPGGVSVEVDVEPIITSLLPPLYALYGDPLLESFFLSSSDGSNTNTPSQALLEGYGGTPIVFRRQKTKRVWYDVLLCLAILLVVRGETIDEERKTKGQWALRRLTECVEILKDAPCY